MRTGRATLAAAVLLGGLAIAGCAPATEAAPQPTAEETTSPAPVDTPQPTQTPTAEAAPACDTIIPETTVEDLTDLGWQPLQEPFVLASIELEDGLICKWGDPAVPSDHVQIYGWSAITDSEAGSAQLDLVANGWRREDAAEGVYITESAETTTGTDDDGYGWTYLFGDGWVKFADTKQSLLLIEWPPA